jgi:hypothetical protein
MEVVLAQVLQWSFLAGAVLHGRRARKIAPARPCLTTVGTAMAKVERLPVRHLQRVLLREPTLLSPFLNYRFHVNMVEMVRTRRLWSCPLPAVAAPADSPVNALH